MPTEGLVRPARNRKPSNRIIKNFEIQFNALSQKIPYTCKECLFSTLSIHKYLNHVVDSHMQKNDETNSSSTKKLKTMTDNCDPTLKRSMIDRDIMPTTSISGLVSDDVASSNWTTADREISPINLRKFSNVSGNMSVQLNDHSYDLIGKTSIAAIVPENSHGNIPRDTSLQDDHSKLSNSHYLEIGSFTKTTNEKSQPLLDQKSLVTISNSSESVASVVLDVCKNRDSPSTICLVQASETSRVPRTLACCDENLSQGSKSSSLSKESTPLPVEQLPNQSALQNDQDSLQTFKLNVNCEQMEETNSGTNPESMGLSSSENNDLCSNATTSLTISTSAVKRTKVNSSSSQTREIPFVKKTPNVIDDTNLKIVSVCSKSGSEDKCEEKISENKVEQDRSVLPYSPCLTSTEKMQTKSTEKMQTLLHSGVVTMRGDHNSLLFPTEKLEILERSFLEFPYPPVQRLKGLSAATKLSISEIKSWFVDIRLLNGVSWDPDEIHDAWAYLRDYQSDVNDYNSQ